MDRRRFLAAAGTGITAVSAGCLGIGVPGTGGHPLAGTTPTVRVDDDSDGPHDVEANAREALSFWEEHSEEYAGFEVGFELVDGDDPDMVIAYGDDPRGCEGVPNYSSRVLGCAPLLREGSRVNRPIVARVVAATRPFGEIRTTTKHEIGHVLGLDHDDEPRYIMSNRPEDRIPLYALRLDIWETVLDAQEASTAATSLLVHGIDTYRREAYAAAVEALEAVAAEMDTLCERIEAAIDSTAAFEGHEYAETVALDRLRELLGRLRDRLAAAGELATALAASARAAIAGETDERDATLTTAIERADEFDAIVPVQLREIAFALGLVRGTDRDERIVELEEEPPEEP